MTDAVRLTRLPNGLTVVTERMPRVETVSFGAYVAAGTRHERRRRTASPTSSSTWPSRAPRSATPLAIAREIETVGGHLNAYTARENTAYYVQGAEGGYRAGRRHHRRHPDPLHLRSRGAGARAGRDPAGDRPGERHAGRHHLRPLPGAPPIPASRSAARCWAPRTVIKGDAADHADRLHAPPLRPRRRWWSPPPARSTHEQVLDLVQTPFRRPAAGGAAAAERLALRRRRVPRGATTWTRCISCSASPRSATATATVLPDAAAVHAAGRRHVVAAVPGDPREARAGLFDLLVQPALPWMAGCSASMPAPARARPRS